MPAENDASWDYTELFPLGPDDTQYRLVTTEGVSTFDTPEGTFLKVEPEAIRALTAEAMRDIAHPLNSDTREQIEQRVLEEYESAQQNRILANRGKQGPEDNEKSTSVLDRLSARLFNEEFWASDVPSIDGNKE